MRYPAVGQWALVALAYFVVPSNASAQRLSFGVIGGTNLTHDFRTARTEYIDDGFPTGLSTSLLFSDSHSFIAGPTMEVGLTKGFSVDINALHRTLQLQSAFAPPGSQPTGAGGSAIGTWEFPVLLKYKFGTSKVQPFVEAGPSFRVRKNPVATDPSAHGVSAGLGVEFCLGRFRVTPTVRYTRWEGEPPFPQTAVNTKPDQIELLTGISYATSPESWNIFGRKFHVGPIAGGSLSDGLAPNPRVEAPISESQGYAAGLMLQFDITQRFSMEADGIYRPLRAHLVDPNVPFSVITWQFPVLAEYKLLQLPKVQPFVEAGPSFRLSGNLNG